MADKIWLKEIETNKEFQVDLDLRCARAPKDYDVAKKKAPAVVRDEGSLVHMQAGDMKFRCDTFEVSDMKIGERIFAKAGSSKLGATTWPLFEVMSGPQPEKK
jgi:hypothetical protein